MEGNKESEKVFRLVCPCCRSALWVDALTREVIRTERGAARERSSLDDLLMKEEKRRTEFDRKFEATAELEKKKREKAKEQFEKALTDVKPED